MEKVIDIIAGARPNFMKIAPIIRALEARAAAGGFLRYRLVHTGQHYDPKLSGAFFEQLGIPEPDVNLEVGSGTQAEQTAAIMTRYEKLLLEAPSALCLVVGDVTSTMACAIAAQKLCIPVAHVEGGIRSGDWTMPEEINRMVTDAITNWFFTTSEVANENLRRAGVGDERIFFVGNTMIDTLLTNIERLRPPAFWDELGLEPGGYFVTTLHRPANVDRGDSFVRLLAAIGEGTRGLPVVFPVHPRTAKQLRELPTLPSLRGGGADVAVQPPHGSPQGFASRDDEKSGGPRDVASLSVTARSPKGDVAVQPLHGSPRGFAPRDDGGGQMPSLRGGAADAAVHTPVGSPRGFAPRDDEGKGGPRDDEGKGGARDDEGKGGPRDDEKSERTRVDGNKSSAHTAAFPGLHLVDPQPYLEFNYLVKHAKAVITDSGGITEEATVMGVPCMTLRDSTERPETITIGTNELIGTDPAALKPALDRLFADGWKKGAVPERWDGRAAERIVASLEELLASRSP